MVISLRSPQLSLIISKRYNRYQINETNKTIYTKRALRKRAQTLKIIFVTSLVQLLPQVIPT